MMVSFYFVSLTTVNKIFIFNILYRNRSLFSFLVFIFYLNFHRPWAFLSFNIALFKDRSDGKYLCKFYHRLIWIKVSRIIQVDFFDCTANAALCYPRQKLLCIDTRELVLIELKYLNTWFLFADEFCQHFYSLSVIKFIELLTDVLLKPGRISAEIQILDGRYGGV